MVDSLCKLRERLECGEALVAGCLSGTSADGVDVALVRSPRDPGAAPELLAFRTTPFPARLHGRIRSILDAGEASGARVSLADLALLDRDLGEAFGAAVRDLGREEGLAVDLVGSHGQTLWHHDGVEPRGRASLQLGDGARIAAATGATVVNDFRAMDLALGGEGAPISALADPILFGALGQPAALLNLGGLANLTLLVPGEAPEAFDTGPAGSLLDGLARRLLDREWDEGGGVAAAGTASAELVARLLGHPFFLRVPPKSTGRETFGEAYVEEVLRTGAGLGTADLLASAVELVAASVAGALDRFARPRPRRLILCGGGVHNRALLAALGRRTGLAPESSSLHGIDPDAREALVFAVLARMAVEGRPSTSPRATGAGAGGVLGAIHLAPNPSAVAGPAQESAPSELG